MSKIVLLEEEIEFSAIRAQGAGGQNVNKVSSALHLRFDIRASSLPEIYKQRLLRLNDSRINKDGVIVIKAQQFRSQEQNREEGIERLRALLELVSNEPVIRRPTKPTRASQRKRMVWWSSIFRHQDRFFPRPFPAHKWRVASSL